MSRSYVYVVLSGLLQGLIVVGAGYFAGQGLSLYEISLLFPLPATLVLGLIALSDTKRYGFNRNDLPHLIIYGSILSVMTLAQFAGVVLGTPIAVVVFLLYTQPLWTIVFSRVLFKEKLTATRAAAAAFVMLGILFLANPLQLNELGSVTGIIASLIGGLSLSLWVVYGGYLTKRGIDPVTTALSWTLFGFIFIALSYPILSTVTNDPSLIGVSFNLSPQLWVLFFVYGVLTLAAAPFLYLEGVRSVPVINAGIILLLEPISAALLAALLFGQALTNPILIGALFILCANYLVIRHDSI